MHDSPAPAQPRSVHPFAYKAGSALPFAALAGDDTDAEDEAMERLAEQSRPRPESEVLSRGAGMKYLARSKDATPGAGLVGVGSSIGMGGINIVFEGGL